MSCIAGIICLSWTKYLTISILTRSACSDFRIFASIKTQCSVNANGAYLSHILSFISSSRLEVTNCDLQCMSSWCDNSNIKSTGKRFQFLLTACLRCLVCTPYKDARCLSRITCFSLNSNTYFTIFISYTTIKRPLYTRKNAFYKRFVMKNVWKITSYTRSYFQVTQEAQVGKNVLLFRTSGVVLWEDRISTVLLGHTERHRHHVSDTRRFLRIELQDVTTKYDQNQNQQITQLLRHQQKYMQLQDEVDQSFLGRYFLPIVYTKIVITMSTQLKQSFRQSDTEDVFQIGSFALCRLRSVDLASVAKTPANLVNVKHAWANLFVSILWIGLDQVLVLLKKHIVAHRYQMPLLHE